MKIAVIHQPQYLPYLGFFHKLLQGDIFVVLDSVQYQKLSFQNRNKVKTRQGCQWLTVPAFHHSKSLIYEVQIDSKAPWQRKHWNMLMSNYSRAPYFDMYGPELQQLLAREWSNLCELNITLIRWVMDALDINKPILYSSALEVGGSKTDLNINICKAVGADVYLSGPGGRNYMDLTAFEAAGINTIWQEFSSPSYAQVFPEVGFLPDLSIVDALFCCGPETGKFLERGRAKSQAPL